jgi:F-type H+/Na+-transporting ATPase subunit beta
MSHPNPQTANHGLVVAVRGSVVDLRFETRLPAIYQVLRAGSEGQIRIEVLAQLDARHVRGIALTPTQGLARGMWVEDSGGPLMAPVGTGILGACSTCSAMPSTANRHPLKSNGAPCIAPRRP